MNDIVKYIIESKYKFNIDDIDNENQNSLAKLKHNSKSLKLIYEIVNNIVDLELPSKTMWCEYNLGVNPDKLNTPEDWYGGYYAWGEIICNKSHYSWQLYSFSFSDSYDLTKYNTKVLYGYYGNIDERTELELKDDAAYLNLHINNLKFKIPTKELVEELIDYTNKEYVRDYKEIEDLNGMLFKSINNNNSIFFPATGYYDNRGLQYCTIKGGVWTSNINDDYPYYAYSMFINNLLADITNSSRYEGLPIRPVLMK